MSATEKKIELKKLLPELDDKYLDIFLENQILKKEDLINLEKEDIIDLGLPIGPRAYVKCEVARLKGEATTENSNVKMQSARTGQTTDPLETSAAASSSESKSEVSRKIFRPNMDFSEKRRDHLIEKIKNFIPFQDAKVPHVNIILVGQQGSGKSSLFNTLDSTLHDEIRRKAEARDESKSVTLEIVQHKLRGKYGEELNITISDTMGIGRGGQVDEAMKKTLQEGVLPGMKNSRENRMHCGVFVIPLDSVKFPAQDVIAILLQFQTAFIANNIKYIVALTKIDALDDKQTDLREIYHSEEMQKRVGEIAKLFRITTNRVWPLKNYTDEVDGCDLYIDILALSILQIMITDANCTLELDIDNATMTQKHEREQEAIRQARRLEADVEEMKRKIAKSEESMCILM